MLQQSTSLETAHAALSQAPASDDRNPATRAHTKIAPYGHVCFVMRFHTATPRLHMLGTNTTELVFALTDESGRVVPCEADAGSSTCKHFASLTADAPYVLEILSATALSQWVEISTDGHICLVVGDLSATRHAA